ncbi:MAG: phosphotransferase [Gammaproteobacteria bacterium]|nr:phosphotransferase [Gammaproteobacteria bacterium]
MSKRLKQLENWLQTDCGFTHYKIEPASGDASFRRYFRITLPDNSTRIAMDAPPDKEDCEPFVRVARQFEKIGLNVPSILAENHDQGFLLLKDLGSIQYLDKLDSSNVDQLYGDALSALQTLQLSCDPGELPKYDKKLLMQEMELFREWLLKKHLGIALSDEENHILDETFEMLAANALRQPRVCVHRDFHSRNLMMPSRPDHGPAPGILDFQDAVDGPITYDLVSLLKDCYIEWPREKVIDWVIKYRQQCVQAGLLKPEEEGEFLRWFDLMGVQRHLKAAGIFARLNIRDGKNGYLNDIPRTVGYIHFLGDVYPELEALAKLIHNYPSLSFVTGYS